VSAAPATDRIPVAILGGSGYVAGEVLRLVAQHPVFAPAMVVSESHAGEPVAAAFPHLACALDGERFAAFTDLEALLERSGRVALVSAAPHGASAPAIDRALAVAEARGAALEVVDLSADFRFASPEEYRAVYGREHPAPARLAGFARAVPEQWRGEVPRRVAHPGCFSTAALLAIVPLVARALAHPRFAVTAITGSTGAGRGLTERTHHPARRSNLAAYSPLAHRHAPEIRALARAATGVAPEVDFVPVAGPHARGIYAVVHARLARAADAGAVTGALTDFYRDSPFVGVSEAPPDLTEVVGTNRARVGVAVAGDALAVTVAIDNLVKGAAGGAVQWLNRMFELPERAGLDAPGLGWI